ncbi:DEAD/DEAH box helicase family protein, partial [Bacillus mycoides]|uniref:DEAD/DEAH box helicase family protein n=1 Tax=Bacillus mycoides TaxID=1405 RepID=UPI003D648102
MIVDKLLNDAQEEEAKRLSMQAFRIEPLLWLRDRFGEDPTGLKWSEHGAFDDSHKFDGTPDPLYTAWKHVADGHRRVAIKSATGIGKTYWLSRLTYWFLDCYENSLVIAAGPTVTQLKDNYWTEMKAAFRKFNRLRPNSEIFTNKLVVGGDYEDADDFEKAGWGVVSRSGTLEGGASKQKNNQVKAQGSHREHMLIIVDEAAGVSNALIKTFEATVGAKHNMIVLVGNPDSKYDSLSKFADKPSARAVQASGYDHINVVAGEEIIAGAITNYQIKDFRTDYGEDSAFYKSRVRGIVPDQLDDVLIKSDWIKQCYTEDIEKDDSVA